MTAVRMGGMIINEAADQRLISKAYKELMQLNITKTKNPTKKWAGGLRDISPKTHRRPGKAWKGARRHSLLLLSRFSVSDSVRPHRRQPTRLPRPWDSPGKHTHYQRNANPNHSVISSHQSERSSSKTCRQQTLESMWRKGSPPAPLVGI